MQNTDLETDEAHLNQKYFLALRAAAKASIPTACSRYGVDAEFARRVSEMTITEIERICLDKMVAFRPAIDTAQFMLIAGIESSSARHIVARLSIKVN